jgi:hypothetical protein
MSLFLMLLAMAMFMVGCDAGSQPLPSGAPDAGSGLDADYQPPPEEQEGQPVTEGEAQPAEAAPAEAAPAEATPAEATPAEPAAEAPAEPQTP